MYKHNTVGVIIPAAGSGVRMAGTVKKQFLELAGKPVWVHTVEKFQACSEIDCIVVAAPPDSVNAMEQQAGAMNLSKVHAIVEGGKHRQDSVALALGKMKTFAPDIILVHDAVRPFVSSKLIEDVLEAVVAFGAAIPAVLPKETVKVSGEDMFVDTTPDRSTLWIVQTPQGFRSQLLYDAFDRASKDGFFGTDEASLVERIGSKVKIVAGSEENVKITTAKDIRYAEFFMRERLS